MSLSGVVIEWIVSDESADDDLTGYVIGTPETVTPMPEIPPPVWDDRPIDSDRCMAAVRAMCG
jgi:hypothetical protein